MLGGTSIGSIGCGRPIAGAETVAASAASKVRPTLIDRTLPAVPEPFQNPLRAIGSDRRVVLVLF
jgi:hypothetical protein